MKRELEIIKIDIEDILFELVYSEEEIEVWVTRENFGIKFLMWGFLRKYKMLKEDIIRISIREFTRNYSNYWEEALEL